MYNNFNVTGLYFKIVDVLPYIRLFIITLITTMINSTLSMGEGWDELLFAYHFMKLS